MNPQKKGELREMWSYVHRLGNSHFRDSLHCLLYRSEQHD